MLSFGSSRFVRRKGARTLTAKVNSSPSAVMVLFQGLTPALFITPRLAVESLVEVLREAGESTIVTIGLCTSQKRSPHPPCFSHRSA